MTGNTKIIVLDDDPTGSQTVHSCLLLTRWDVATLCEALQDASSLFFILTNTRGMDAAKAAQITREACQNLKLAIARYEQQAGVCNTILVSRSDSTLRGHYPIETDVIAAELEPFDAHFLVPAFFEGGRITRDSTHYLMVDGKAVPVHKTEFAKDSVFGFSTAYLPDYVEEKTKGVITAAQVERFTLQAVRADSQQRLLGLKNNTCVVVDAEEQNDLNHFAAQLKQATAAGKRFLFRSGASLLTALAGLPPQQVPAQDMAKYARQGKPGAILVGSHVKKSTAQLKLLLQQPAVQGIEVNVGRIVTDRANLLTEVTTAAANAHVSHRHPVIYTTRLEKTFDDERQRLHFGEQVSAFLMDIVRRLPDTLGYLISKGGITSNDVLSDALALKTSRVLGQILPGCSVIKCPENHQRFPGMPVVIFPGNVGSNHALVEAYLRIHRAHEITP